MLSPAHTRAWIETTSLFAPVIAVVRSPAHTRAWIETAISRSSRARSPRRPLTRGRGLKQVLPRRPHTLEQRVARSHAGVD